MSLIEGVEYIVVDKREGLGALRRLRQDLAGRRFDVLLHMQLALRANLYAASIRADLRVGFDRERSKELHGLVVNRRIAHRPHQHVQDALLSFLEPLGLVPTPPRWDFPLREEDEAFAAECLPGEQPTLIISPCSSHRLRNWSVRGYAEAAAHAVRRHGLRVALCGGPSALERDTAASIEASAGVPIVNLVGRDTLPRLVALLRRARLLLSPDSGPVHLANAVGTRVLGLHAATPAWRSGPYSDRRFCVDRYDAAARKFLGKPAQALPWGKRVEFPGVMDLIEVDAVRASMDAALAEAQPGPGPQR
jgi:heptosyltransferase I